MPHSKQDSNGMDKSSKIWRRRPPQSSVAIELKPPFLLGHCLKQRTLLIPQGSSILTRGFTQPNRSCNPSSLISKSSPRNSTSKMPKQ
ncbi:hypothetical protein C365_03435 [Cryptococcus neoformans Bt85]|nr:hypothetical protein C365_03435 [Cryptococcus neoformans var. grubii Bt85]